MGRSGNVKQLAAITEMGGRLVTVTEVGMTIETTDTETVAAAARLPAGVKIILRMMAIRTAQTNTRARVH